MFNTYQELADRIDELLEERKHLLNKIKHLEDLYSKVPQKTINDMYFRKEIDKEERLFWVMLKLRKDDNNERFN